MLSVISFSDLLTTLISIMTLLGLMYGALKFLSSGFFRPIKQFYSDFIDIVKTHKLLKQQILPNGGSSISDTVKRIEIRQCIADGMDRAITEKVNAIIFESSAEGKCLAVSRSYMAFTGKQKEDVLDFGWINCIDEEDRERLIEEWLLAIKQKREYIGHYKMIDKDGNRIPVTCRTFVVLGPNLEIIRYIGLIEKVHEKNI